MWNHVHLKLWINILTQNILWSRFTEKEHQYSFKYLLISPPNRWRNRLTWRFEMYNVGAINRYIFLKDLKKSRPRSTSQDESCVLNPFTPRKYIVNWFTLEDHFSVKISCKVNLRFIVLLRPSSPLYIFWV